MRPDASGFDAVWEHIRARAMADQAQSTLIESFVREDGHRIQAVQAERIRVTSHIPGARAFARWPNPCSALKGCCSGSTARPNGGASAGAPGFTLWSAVPWNRRRQKTCPEWGESPVGAPTAGAHPRSAAIRPIQVP
jgi:hypothetical protein